jgi:hypothetical protein
LREDTTRAMHMLNTAQEQEKFSRYSSQSKFVLG